MAPPRLTRQEKDRAAEQLESVKDAEADFAVAVPLLALPAYAFGVVAPYGLVAAVLVALLARLRRRSERAVDDPPRRDYTFATQAHRPRIDVKAALVGSEFAIPGIAAGDSLRTYIANLSALVRSIERAQGAAAATQRLDLDRHLGEARRFAFELTASAPTVRRDLSELAQILSSELTRSRLDEELTVGSTAITNFDPRVLAPEHRRRLDAAGILPSLLGLNVPSRFPRTEDVMRGASSLAKLGGAMQQFATALADGGIEV